MSKGTRLPEDWQPDAKLTTWVYEEFAVTPLQLKHIVEEFVDYWISIPGKSGTKLNWNATFRNRCRQVFRRYRRATASRNGGQSTGVVL